MLEALSAGKEVAFGFPGLFGAEASILWESGLLAPVQGLARVGKEGGDRVACCMCWLRRWQLLTEFQVCRSRS